MHLAVCCWPGSSSDQIVTACHLLFASRKCHIKSGRTRHESWTLCKTILGIPQPSDFASVFLFMYTQHDIWQQIYVWICLSKLFQMYELELTSMQVPTHLAPPASHLKDTPCLSAHVLLPSTDTCSVFVQAQPRRAEELSHLGAALKPWGPGWGDK